MTTSSAVSHRSSTTRRTPLEHHRAATEVLRNSGHPHKDGRIVWYTAPPKPKVTWPFYHWHCEHCRSMWLSNIIGGLKPARLVSKLFYEVDRLAIVTELPQREQKRWNGMRWRWTALCWICGEQRRNRPRIARDRHGDKIHSHTECRHAQLRGRRKYTKAQVEARAKG